jgi:hypothetical protein
MFTERLRKSSRESEQLARGEGAGQQACDCGTGSAKNVCYRFEVLTGMPCAVDENKGFGHFVYLRYF